MKLTVPLLLSFNGGYVDTAGFLALQGLFTAHVTGNFVTFGATLAHGASGAVSKLLALPVFCIVVVATRMISFRLPSLGLPVLKTMLMLKVVLLALGAALAIAWGPFSNSDEWRAMVTGMVLVAAMAIQNAAHRIHLPKAPPSTLMTGTTTQIMIDVADVLGAGLADKARAEALARLVRMSATVGVFAAGCVAGALTYAVCGVRVFLAAPMIALLALAVIYVRSDPDIA